MFREDKVTAAAWWFVNKNGGPLPHVKLMKLLYLAERKWLLERGVMMFEDTFVSMAKGPVLSSTYDSMKRGSRTIGKQGYVWQQHLSAINNHQISKKSDLDVLDFLTPKQVQFLESTWQEHGHLSEDQIVEFAHELREWKNTNSSIPINIPEFFELNEPNPVRREQLCDIYRLQRGA